MSGRILRTAAAAIIAALTLALAACGNGLSDAGEELTIAQADQLAAARFQLYSQNEFVAHVVGNPSSATDHFVADVTVSALDHLAWGTLVRGPENLGVTDELAYSPEGAATRQNGVWAPAAWGATEDYSGLVVVFGLAADRPENAQLLRQSGARYLGREQLDGVETSVFRLPATDGESGVSRLWLDADGSIVRFDDGSDVFVITITKDAPTPRPDGLDALFGSDGTGG